MSWSQAFTILTEEHISDYHNYASLEEKGRIESLFSGHRMDSQDSEKNLICLTLSPHLLKAGSFAYPFSTNRVRAKATLPIPDSEPLNPNEFVSVILKAALSLAVSHPKTVLRIYLDPAWKDLAGRLVEGKCQVFLMDHASDGPNPAQLWRYLALEEHGKSVTFIGIESLSNIDKYMERTKALEESGLKVWRMPMDRRRNYRPINPDCFASVQSYPARELLYAYTWYVRHPTTPLSSNQKGAMPLAPSSACEKQASWDRGDLEEFFLLSAFYPRASFDGILTLIDPDDQHSRWMILDTEYVMWANPASETLFVAPLYSSGPSHNFCVNAMIETLFHMNRYPEYQDAWIKQEQESKGAHLCSCCSPEHPHKDYESLPV